MPELDPDEPRPGPDKPQGWRQYAFGVLLILACAAVFYFWRTAGAAG
jgi:hypothetical protein